MGLSGAEVVYRVQSKIDDYAPAGTLPPGEVEGFWGQLELACTNLRERVLEEDLGKRFQCLEEVRIAQLAMKDNEENRVCDPGVT